MRFLLTNKENSRLQTRIPFSVSLSLRFVQHNNAVDFPAAQGFTTQKTRLFQSKQDNFKKTVG